MCLELGVLCIHIHQIQGRAAPLPFGGVFVSRRVARLIQSMICIFFAGIQAKPTFNKHTARVLHSVERWEADGELQEPSGWDDGLDI